MMLQIGNFACGEINERNFRNPYPRLSTHKQTAHILANLTGNLWNVSRIILRLLTTMWCDKYI